MGRRGADVLSRVPMFAGLSARNLRRISDLMEEVRYMEGASIVKEGEEGVTFYIILEGESRVVDRRGRVLTRLRPGDSFGEISLLDGGARTATVVSETPMTLLALGRDRFEKMLREYPDVTVTMLQGAAAMLRRIERPMNA